MPVWAVYLIENMALEIAITGILPVIAVPGSVRADKFGLFCLRVGLSSWAEGCLHGDSLDGFFFPGFREHVLVRDVGPVRLRLE